MSQSRQKDRALDVTDAQLGVAADMSESQIKQLLTQQSDIPQGMFDSYVIDRGPDGELIVRPGKKANV